jgi:hypothetical protein
VERVSVARRRENAAAQRTHRRVGWGRRRHRRAQSRAVRSGQRRSTARVVRRSAMVLSERGTRDCGREAAVGTPTAPLRRVCGVAWACGSHVAMAR